MAFDPGPSEPSAKTMYNFAQNYLKAAECILQNDEIEFTPQGPFYFCVSHAFELFAKSFLMQNRYDCSRLKDLGHGPKGLIQECVNNGFLLEDSEIEIAGVIANVNAYNMQRYPMMGLFNLGPQEYAEPEKLLFYMKQFASKVMAYVEERNAA